MLGQIKKSERSCKKKTETISGKCLQYDSKNGNVFNRNEQMEKFYK